MCANVHMHAVAARHLACAESHYCIHGAECRKVMSIFLQLEAAHTDQSTAKLEMPCCLEGSLVQVQRLMNIRQVSRPTTSDMPIVHMRPVSLYSAFNGIYAPDMHCPLRLPSGCCCPKLRRYALCSSAGVASHPIQFRSECQIGR